MGYTSKRGRRPSEYASKSAHSHIIQDDTVQGFLLQCRLHETGPQVVPTIMSELFDAGAADAWMTPIIGPDGEPAMTVSVVAPARAQREVKAVLQARAGATTSVRVTRLENS